MFKKQAIVVVAIVLMVSCQKQDVNYYPVVFDYGYFPTNSGSWRQYDVTFINVDAPSEVYDTATRQLLEVYTGWYLNAANDSSMRVARYTRDSSHHSWKEYQVWHFYISGTDVIQTEENIKYLKMKFPVQLNYSWNGNSYNRTDTLQEFTYKYTLVHIPDTVGTTIFDSVVTITQKEYITQYDKIYNTEKYAYGVGLVEKQLIDIYSNDIDFTIPIEKRITKGTQYYQKITAYGTN